MNIRIPRTDVKEAQRRQWRSVERWSPWRHEKHSIRLPRRQVLFLWVLSGLWACSERLLVAKCGDYLALLLGWECVSTYGYQGLSTYSGGEHLVCKRKRNQGCVFALMLLWLIAWWSCWLGKDLLRLEDDGNTMFSLSLLLSFPSDASGFARRSVQDQMQPNDYQNPAQTNGPWDAPPPVGKTVGH